MKEQISTSTILLFGVLLILSFFWMNDIRIKNELRETMIKSDTINAINKRTNDSIIKVLKGDYQKEFVVRSKNLNK